MKNKIIEVQHLSYTIRDKAILKDIKAFIPEKSVTLIAGHNGSGKTVLLKHINGLLKIQDGNILFKDKPIKFIKSIAKNIGFVFQNSYAQIVGETALEDVVFSLQNINFKKTEAIEKAKELLNDFDLGNHLDQASLTLSGGELKKLAICGIVALDPEVIILDEPFIGLDYKGVKEVLSAIERLIQRDHTIIIVSHDLSKFYKLISHVVVLKEGECIYCGNKSNAIPSLKESGVYIPKGDFHSWIWQ